MSDIVRRNADFFADSDALIEDGASRSWGEVETRTNKLARAFLSLGLAKGDRISILAPNCAEFVEFFFACAKSGVVGAAVNIRLSARELAAYLRYIEPSGIIVHSSLAESAAEWLPEVPSIRHVLGFGGTHGFKLDLTEAMSAEPGSDPGVDIRDDDVYQIAATSGTTGVPKGAVLNHRNAMGGILGVLAEVPVPQQGTNLQNVPYFFNPGGSAGLNPVFMKGGRSVIAPGFEPLTFFRAVERYRVTNTILVPTMLRMLLARPERHDFDLSSLRGVITGGSPLSRELLMKGRELLGDVFYPMYALTETYASALILRQEDQFTTGTADQVARLSSLGRPNVLTHARVVKDDGTDVVRGSDEVGEIWLRGESVSSGYFRMPEETALSRDGDWFKTGDLAKADEEGFITIVDRKKDMIITGGINVFSIEVETALMQHPDVDSVAVIGVPHEIWGEAIHAVIVPVPGATASVQEILDDAAGRLAGYKKPRSGEFRSQLPVSATGKLLKRELRESILGNC
ncbi:class I adenylate-forming enzyme family protein [Streptomyces sp. Y7]|uniref:class I adenylate-forming enzyme family protein n=1 Tax=Streptomyces sp. Y7 TaxID=3342392 RepID=UPI003716875C